MIYTVTFNPAIDLSLIHIFSGQIDGELPALAQQLMAVPRRAHADGYHAGLGADGACPADGDKVGLIQPAAGSAVSYTHLLFLLARF